MKTDANIGIGVLIGAGLAGSVGSTISQFESKIIRIRAMSERIEIGKNTATKIQQLSRKMRELEIVEARLGRTDETQRQYKELSRELEKASRMGSLFGVSMQNAGVKSKQFGAIIAQNTLHLKLFDELAKSKMYRQQLYGDLMRISIVGAALFFPIKSAATFENTMGQVATMVDTTKVSMTSLSSTALQVSKELGMSAVQVSQAMYQALSAGVSPEKVAEFLRISGKAAIGGASDIFTATDGLTSIMNAFKFTMTDMGKVSDSVFLAIKAGKTTFSEIASSIGNVAPIASQAGISLDELLAAMATSTTMGLKTSEAFTGLRGILNQLISPTEKSKKIFSDLGIRVDALTLKEKGLKGTIEMITNAVRQQTADEGKQKQMLGEIFDDIEALNSVFVLTGSGAETFNSIMNQMKTTTGSADDAFQKMQKTVTASWNRMKAQIGATAITLGSIFLPAVSEMMDSVGKAVGVISTFAEKHPVLTKVIVFATTALIAFRIAVIAARISVSHLKDTYAIAKTFFTGITSGAYAAQTQLAFVSVQKSAGNFASMLPLIGTRFAGVFRTILTVIKAHPVGRIIAIIIGAAVLIIANWKRIKPVFDSIWSALKPVANAFKDIYDAVMNVFREIWNALLPVFEELGNAIKELFTELKPVFVEVGTAIKSFMAVLKPIIKNVFETLRPVFRSIFEGIKAALHAIIPLIGKLFNTFKPVIIFLAKAGIVAVIGSIVVAIGAFAGALWVVVKVITFVIKGITWIIHGIKTLVETVSIGAQTVVEKVGNFIRSFSPLSIIKNAFSKVTTFFKTINWIESGKRIIGTLIAGIKAATTKLFDTVKSAFKKVRKLMPFSDAQEGPFSDLTLSGTRIMTTISTGVKQAAPDLKNTVSKSFADTKNSVGPLSKNNAASGVTIQNVNITITTQSIDTKNIKTIAEAVVREINTIAKINQRRVITDAAFLG